MKEFWLDFMEQQRELFDEAFDKTRIMMSVLPDKIEGTAHYEYFKTKALVNAEFSKSSLIRNELISINQVLDNDEVYKILFGFINSAEHAFVRDYKNDSKIFESYDMLYTNEIRNIMKILPSIQQEKSHGVAIGNNSRVFFKNPSFFRKKFQAGNNSIIRFCSGAELDIGLSDIKVGDNSLVLIESLKPLNGHHHGIEISKLSQMAIGDYNNSAYDRLHPCISIEGGTCMVKMNGSKICENQGMAIGKSTTVLNAIEGDLVIKFIFKGEDPVSFVIPEGFSGSFPPDIFSTFEWYFGGTAHCKLIKKQRREFEKRLRKLCT